MRYYFYVFLWLCGITLLNAEPEIQYQFKGYELQANYLECDEDALLDVERLSQAMVQAVKECGATILNSVEHRFEPMGFTMLLLLSESHASIHTYPEQGKCFVDLFTCGENCDAEKFDAVLRAYLQPKQVDKTLYVRDEQGIREIAR